MDKNCSKNVRWGPLNAKMTKTATLGSANPLTVTNLGGGGTKTDLFTWNRATVKLLKNILAVSTLNTQMVKTVTFSSAISLTLTNLEGSSKKLLLFI